MEDCNNPGKIIMQEMEEVVMLKAEVGLLGQGSPSEERGKR